MQNTLVLPNTGVLPGLTMVNSLNSMMETLVTLNSGASAPATTYPYMVWADTTNNVIKQRNAADDAWIIRGSLLETRVIPQTANFTSAISGFAALYVCTNSITATLTAAATLGDGWFAFFRNNGTGAVTINPNGSELIDGEVSIILGPSESCLVFCNATAFHTVGRSLALADNILINGPLNVWQAGTSFTGLTTGLSVADMMSFPLSSAGTWTVARNSDTPTAAQAGTTLNYSLRATCTTSDATISAGDYALMAILVEGYDYAPLIGKTQTIQFWAKSNKLGTYVVGLRNQVDRSYLQTITIDVVDTWELKTVTITTAPVAGGTWNTTNGTGVVLFVSLACGSTFQGTSGQWNNGDLFGVSGQVNLADANSNYFAIADVRLVAGTNASRVNSGSFQEQLAKCQRYYEKSFPYATAPTNNGGNSGMAEFPQTAGASINMVFGTIPYKVTKRTNPTVTLYNPTAGNAGQVRNFSVGADCTLSSVQGSSNDSAFSVSGTTSAGSGASNTNAFHWVSDARL